MRRNTNFKRMASWFLTLCMLLGMINVPVARAADSSYYVAGSGGLCGVEWIVDANPMTPGCAATAGHPATKTT